MLSQLTITVPSLNKVKTLAPVDIKSTISNPNQDKVTLEEVERHRYKFNKHGFLYLISWIYTESNTSTIIEQAIITLYDEISRIIKQ